MATPGTPIFGIGDTDQRDRSYEVGAFAQVNLVVEYQGIQSGCSRWRVSDTSARDLHAEFHRSGQARGESEQHLQRTALSQHHSGPTGLGDRPWYATGGGQSSPSSNYRTRHRILDPVPDSGDESRLRSGRARDGRVHRRGSQGIVTAYANQHRVPKGVSGNALRSALDQTMN